MGIYRRLRPGEVGTVDSRRSCSRDFFDPKRYDMMRVGRHKYNKAGDCGAHPAATWSIRTSSTRPRAR